MIGNKEQIHKKFEIYKERTNKLKLKIFKAKERLRYIAVDINKDTPKETRARVLALIEELN